MQKTLVLLKPDAVQRRLIGELISRLERKGLKLAGMKLVQMDDALARRHYAEHVDKPFYGDLVAFMSRGPVVAMVVEGPSDTFAVVRTLMGATDPTRAAPGTIRGDFGLLVTENLVHGSDAVESAEREIGIFFPEE